MEDNKIKIELSDWLYNAGVVGLYNILEHNGDKVQIKDNFLEFEINSLENFEEKYFKYFIEKYEKFTSWYKIISFQNKIEYWEEDGFQNFNEKSLEELNSYIRDVLKKYLKSNSYIAAYDLINNDFDIKLAEKEISTINLKKNQEFQDILNNIKLMIEKIIKIINYFKEDESKKYLAGKNVMYNIIKNGWNGVCFLNARTKEKDMYIDYKKYFVDSTIEYNKVKKDKFKYNCFLCDREMKDLNNDLSFLNATGFDTKRKSSHVWNFTNDVAVCPICKLIYSCVPAGINYVYSKGIFINDNSNIDSLININQKVRDEILKEHETNNSLTYRAMIIALEEEINDKVKYELSDIQLVRYDEEKYRFNILSKKLLEVLRSSRDDLNKLIKTGFNEINTYFNIYEEVLKKIMNGENLFLFIHKLLSLKLSKPVDAHYKMSHLKSMMYINIKFLKGVGFVENIEKDIIDSANKQGYFLRTEYENRNSENKIGGICYRLLNGLKTNNKDMFMDVIMNCYLYIGKTVPKIFIEALKSDENFKTIGYAFVSGLINEKDKNNGGSK
ncbi:CRISPR-associated protein Cst1 [Hypnocyclicus thermotrophus]|uniref:CRISPR-associated protein Cst1 n=1 Tax=Hypnocyclicus thermotrophus TaxID=1627895 RepID=A0AA46I560_9FUSO|nr:type I-B CRISPR-associated protein Cas8b1/Cst1 [Hypnocyclicus thermotrophus]TDT67024.1 CRISPR-associated protein Cst1 [Hypnocyclicus thermotrophus]